MNQLFDRSKAKIICYSMDIIFLCIHFLMLYIFASNDVSPMVKFNIFSITFYACSLLAIRFDFLRFFIIASYMEILLHMTLAIIYTGWGNGFQITIIGINSLAFFAEYVGRSLRGKYVPAAPLGILGMILYIFSYIFVYKNGVLYPLSDKTSFFLQIMWALVVFLILIACLYLFTLLSFHSARLLSIAATKDKLTELPNRYHITKYEKEYLSPDRWIALADIDDFKKINDTYGHNFGDFVLKKLAELMQKELKHTDICRWGGEEFLIIGNGKNIDKAFKELDNFRKTIEEFTFAEGDTETRLTITIGLASYKQDISMTEWINIADKKLYAGKYSGKNQVIQ
ncbi:MAG: GGDEF domain-containing protein [Eubacterium sp.]|nr:GGDEF domain-containing protein [Eubacterium sp.]